jgi:hypothetical protein
VKVILGQLEVRGCLLEKEVVKVETVDVAIQECT